MKLKLIKFMSLHFIHISLFYIYTLKIIHMTIHLNMRLYDLLG